MPDCLPFREPGQNPTCHADAAITGCRFVKVKTGVNAIEGHPRVIHATAGAKVFGVSSRDAASQSKLMIYRWGEVPILAGAALSHGQQVVSDATGRAIPWVDFATNGPPQGTVMADAADATLAHIALELGA